MNSIRVLLNAVTNQDIKITLDLKNGINYKCYIYNIILNCDLLKYTN